VVPEYTAVTGNWKCEVKTIHVLHGPSIGGQGRRIKTALDEKPMEAAGDAAKLWGVLDYRRLWGSSKSGQAKKSDASFYLLRHLSTQPRTMRLILPIITSLRRKGICILGSSDGRRIAKKAH
jgi:hypothetical protein